MMHDARAVANYFLDRAEKNRAPITIMTLLKVLYFSHAWHLVKFRKPLVAQPFEAWRHGPVNRVVYEQFKDLGDKPIIGKKAVAFDPFVMEFVVTQYDFDEETTLFLANIFDYYSKFHPFKLSDLTHEKGGPWDIIWSEAGRRAVPGMMIPNNLIQDWFEKHDELNSADRERRLPT